MKYNISNVNQKLLPLEITYILILKVFKFSCCPFKLLSLVIVTYSEYPDYLFIRHH